VSRQQIGVEEAVDKTMARSHVIFGIDPGSVITGYGAIRIEGNTVSFVDAGVIATKSGTELSERLAVIYDGLTAKLREHAPSRVCVEEAFYAKNVHTTLILGHARGVALLAAHQAGSDVREFSPREIKKAIVGNGNATKDQVEYMVKVLLSPPQQCSHADAYDALATALCGFYHSGRTTTIPAVR